MRIAYLLLAALVPLAACGDSGEPSDPTVAVGVVASPALLSFADCDSVLLHAHLVNADGDSLGGGSFAFASSGPSIASVNSSGLVRGMGSGSTSIRVASGAFEDTVLTNVSPSTDSQVVFVSDTIRLLQGTLDTLTPTVKSCHGVTLPGAVVSYHSVSTGTVTVTGVGVITGVSGGTTTVTMASGGDTARATVVVYDTVHVTIETSVAHANRPYAVAIGTGNAVYVTRLDDAKIARYNLGTHVLANDNLVVGAIPTGVAITPNGAEAYVASQDGNIDILNVANDSLLKTVVIAGSGFNVAITPDGAKAYLGTNINKVYVFSTATRSITDSLSAGTSPGWLVFNPAGDKVFISDFFDGDIKQASVAGGGSSAFQTIGGGPQGMAFSTDGSRLYVARQSGGDILVLNGTSGARVDSIPVPGGSPYGLVRRPGTNLLWVTTLAGHIYVIDPTAKLIVGHANVGGTLRRFAFDAAGTKAVIADEGNQVIFAH